MFCLVSNHTIGAQLYTMSLLCEENASIKFSVYSGQSRQLKRKI